MVRISYFAGENSSSEAIKYSGFLIAFFTVGVYVVDVMIRFLSALVNFDAARKYSKLQGNLRSKG